MPKEPERTIKSGRRVGFTVLYNSVLKDTRLSLKAKGLFAIMMSLPEDWKYTVGGLATCAGVGKDTVRSILNELQGVGYLIREQSHDQSGQFGGNVYILQDEAPPLSGNTDNGETRQRLTPLTESPTLLKKDRTKERLTNTPIAPKRLDAAPSEVTQCIAAYAGEDGELRSAIEGLLENRQAIRKPVKTLRAMTGILKDLDRCSGGTRATKLRLLDKATVSNWLTIYPLKGDELPPAQQEERELDGI